MDGHLLVWGIVVVLVLVGLVVVALLASRRRASRVLTREEQLRLAKRAALQIATKSRKSRRGSLRGTGTGFDSHPNDAAMFGGEGGSTGAP
ncbi:hypothetical protein [Micromonospora parathelypteridis]|uniref:FtsZ-interacting cell division protein ZipA n=1 Tax=Micromonospora parathelypteridis TaxID=1839617 RepID=A0A840VWC7_9ACTN|nr:hypothetical protein [Micromonospora parathelypteridis]MBB5480927.1 FtsZ-interacting cell division protein ZipA [Micromonospora parathelypteridis]GGO20933.1 hypothetical protein GCM10011576_38740 [Micromonospora parathelypteridis]